MGPSQENEATERAVWERYVSSWKAEGAADKTRIFEDCLSPQCVYTDPLTTAKGFQELAAYMVQFHRQIPGGHFATTYFLAHHHQSIAKWEMRGADGEVLGVGMSYGEYGQDGKLTAMTGFFETPSA